MLASEILDSSAALLNDVGLALYTYAIQLPYLKRASEELEQELLVHQISVQKERSAAINVAAYATTLTLPSDFLLPIKLRERLDTTTDEWTDMIEQDFEDPIVIQNTTLQVWAFRDNAINFQGATTNREVLMDYIRALATVSSSSTAMDFTMSKPYLSAKTAELCARYIGMNDEIADRIALREVEPARDRVVRAFVLNQQGIGQRRIPFSRSQQR